MVTETFTAGQDFTVPDAVFSLEVELEGEARENTPGDGDRRRREGHPMTRRYYRTEISESVSDPITDDLESLLTPIASTSVVDTGVEQGLVAREEVRR